MRYTWLCDLGGISPITNQVNEDIMSKIGDVILAIDEELAEAFAVRKVIDRVVILEIADKLHIPFGWVEDRYNDMLRDW
jgi:hypothetical protein